MPTGTGVYPLNVWPTAHVAGGSTRRTPKTGVLRDFLASGQDAEGELGTRTSTRPRVEGDPAGVVNGNAFYLGSWLAGLM